MLCSGQGAQKLGMGLDFVQEIPACAEIYRLAADASGIDVRALCAEGPIEELSLTQNTQPALVACSLATATALMERDVEPDCVAGFSLGEYAAHAIAGTVDAKTALALVSQRARFMADAASKAKGSMAALLRCNLEQAQELCSKHAAALGQVLAPANVNCPGQVVISGQEQVVEAACADWKEQGGKFAPVKTSGAFHSPLMQDAAGRMRPVLEAVDFAAPRIPLYCNRTALPLEHGSEARMLEEQIVSPVLWEATIRNMIADGVERFIECGPGKVLTGMVKRTARDMKADVSYLCVETLEDLEALDA